MLSETPGPSAFLSLSKLQPRFARKFCNYQKLLTSRLEGPGFNVIVLISWAKTH